MLKIMADYDVAGHVRTLVQICELPPWDEFWREAECEFLTLADLGPAEDATDAEIWNALFDLDNLRGTGRLFVP